MITTDFIPDLLPTLYQGLIEQGYEFITFNEYLLEKKPNKFVILRHDVEKYYANALRFAEIQHEMGIRGTYYFRMSGHFDDEAIKEIASLGHETGYHYDDLSQCHGNFEKAIQRFEANLNKLRSITTVETISMEGSPLSKYDNRRLWERYDYRDHEILGEPYFDVDYSEVHYLTDTGRRWNGDNVSLRDKVKLANEFNNIKHTKDLIKELSNGRLPDKLLITFHPQRWTDNKFLWTWELIWQNIKNPIKWVMVKTRY